MTNALSFYESLHGKDCEFLTKHSIVEFGEQYARVFYAQKLSEARDIHDSYFFEEKRDKLPPKPPISDQP